jgi:hypothetical protein
MNSLTLLATSALLASAALAAPVTVVDNSGKPLPTVMISRQPATPAAIDRSDNGYPASGQPQQAYIEITRFTDSAGRVDIPAAEHPWQLRLRKAGYQDRIVASADIKAKLVMIVETDATALALQRPGNAWSSTIDFGDENLKKEFMLQCNSAISRAACSCAAIALRRNGTR